MKVTLPIKQLEQEISKQLPSGITLDSIRNLQPESHEARNWCVQIAHDLNAWFPDSLPEIAEFLNQTKEEIVVMTVKEIHEIKETDSKLSDTDDAFDKRKDALKKQWQEIDQEEKEWRQGITPKQNACWSWDEGSFDISWEIEKVAASVRNQPVVEERKKPKQKKEPESEQPRTKRKYTRKDGKKTFAQQVREKLANPKIEDVANRTDERPDYLLESDQKQLVEEIMQREEVSTNDSNQQP